VSGIADALAGVLGRERVFYDYWFQHELARPNLDTYLQGLYHDQAEMVVLFLCSDYEKKEWCGLEVRAVRDLIKSRKDNQIMLLRTDSATVGGFLPIDGYIDIRTLLDREVAELILRRLSLLRN